MPPTSRATGAPPSSGAGAAAGRGFSSAVGSVTCQVFVSTTAKGAACLGSTTERVEPSGEGTSPSS